MERARRMYAVENEYGLLVRLASGNLKYAAMLEDLLPEWKDQSRISVDFELPGGRRRSEALAIPTTPLGPFKIPGSKLPLPSRTKCDFVYEFLDKDRKTALLVIDGMMGFREAYEMWNTMGFAGNDEQGGSCIRGTPAPFRRRTRRRSSPAFLRRRKCFGLSSRR